jgi:hypothetical protein
MQLGLLVRQRSNGTRIAFPLIRKRLLDSRRLQGEPVRGAGRILRRLKQLRGGALEPAGPLGGDVFVDGHRHSVGSTARSPRKSKYWPQNAAQLGNRVTRAGKPVRAKGYIIDRGKLSGQRIITIVPPRDDVQRLPSLTS